MNNNYLHPYFLNRNVYLFTQDETTQILDFQQGQFYALDPIASLMLSLVLEQGFEKTVTHITQKYETSREQVEADLRPLLSQLEYQKLIISPEKTKNFLIFAQVRKVICLLSIGLLQAIASLFRKIYNSSQNPSQFTVNLLLSLSWLSFRILGWSHTLSLWQTWHESHEIITLNEEETLQKIDQLVREAAASKLFLPVVCKERALVGYHLLRVFYGLPAYLIVGINRHPFQLHAWVECNDKIITDDLAHCEAFLPVVSYPEEKETIKINNP